MTQETRPEPRAYAAGRGSAGVLLIHGYTGSAAETRPMGEYLAERGLTIRCPLLPGHGTVPEDLDDVHWRDWVAAVEASLAELQAKCQPVFVAGLSLGSLLTLWLADHHPEIAGLIALSPAVKLTNRLVPLAVAMRYVWKQNPFGAMEDDSVDPDSAARGWGYNATPLWGAGEVYLLQRAVLRLLPTIRQPILIFQGRHDVHCAVDAAQLLHDHVGSTDKRIVWLENSGHNVLTDSEREIVWEESYRWIRKRSPQTVEELTGKAAQ